MNFEKCANCLLHHWKEVEDETTLQRCKRCKMIKYCGRECQTEHWLKVHHKHCKYFADPVKAQQWDHKEDDCLICQKSTVVGKSQIKRPDNSNYDCIFEEVKKWVPDMIHPHPFPAAGDQGDIYEKSILVQWQLMGKFWHTQPGVVSSCEEEFKDVFTALMSHRLAIWKTRKFSPKPHLHVQKSNPIPIDLSSMDEKVERSRLIPDPFELWKIIKMVHNIFNEVSIWQNLNMLINPLVDVRVEFQEAVTQAVINSAKFLDMANQVLDALATQIIPYRDVLAIIFGGSLEKTCTFCSKIFTIADVDIRGFIRRPSVTVYCCSSSNYCIQKAISMEKHFSRAVAAAVAAVGERLHIRCDFCFLLPPIKDVHRCSKCLSVMYCSSDCMDQDWEIHKKVCKEDVEERKKKRGGSARRKEGREALDMMEKGYVNILMTDKGEEVSLVEATEAVGKLILKKSKK